MSGSDRGLDDLKRALRSVVKEAVWAATSHTPGSKPDIGLFASRRGGSTWLMQVIGSAPGVRSLDQPFSVMTANLTPGHYRRIPKYPYGEIVSPAEDEFEALEAYVTSLLAGELPLNAPYRFWERGFERKTNRQVLKIVGAKSIIEWLDTRFGIQVVYVSRHPITQSLSCIRNGWTLTARAFLDNPRFVDAWLPGPVEARCHDLLSNGTELERFVMNWGLENMVPIRSDRRDHWLNISYEHTALFPDATIELLDSRLDLGGVEILRSALNRPSRSSRLSTAERRSAMRRGDARELVESPLLRVDPKQRAAAMRILDDLGVAIYSPDSALPGGE